MISVISPSRYKIDRKQFKKLATNYLLENGFGDSYDVNIIFAGKNKLKELSQKYKKENEALPVLTFIYDERSDEKRYLGEVFICYPQAVIMAAQKAKKVDIIVARLIIHGLDNIIKNI